MGLDSERTESMLVMMCHGLQNNNVFQPKVHVSVSVSVVDLRRTMALLGQEVGQLTESLVTNSGKIKCVFGYMDIVMDETGDYKKM